ncbi:MAG: DUF402 domain-containing protein [Nocardioides sp.]
MTYAVGGTLTVREVLHGEVWLEFPETVVADDGEVLATTHVDGAPMTHHREHPFGPHPWADADAWRGPTVLKLRKTGEWYSVWKFFDGDAFRHWYVNFELPVVRAGEGIEINDLQLDLVVDPDGVRRWKDVEHLAPALAAGRIDAHQLGRVLAAAAEVTDLLDRDERWWSPWDSWRPSRAPSGDDA